MRNRNCECSNPATVRYKNSWICERCLKLETEHYKFTPLNSVINCEICGKEFVKKFGPQKICMSKECMKVREQLKYINKVKVSKEYQFCDQDETI